jgi:DNA mismatch repair ATPase MutS
VRLEYYPAKVWVNGHERAKRQAHAAGFPFTELANGFAACGDPGRLQAICHQLGPTDIQAFFDRWLARILTPLTLADQAAGYWWELSMRQLEISRKLVLEQPRRARQPQNAK